MARLSNLTERGQETQGLLRDILMRLVVEKGYEHVSIRDITENAGIDRSTFYLHFKDKDDLFAKSQRAVIDELIELRSKGTGAFPGITLTFEHMARNAELYLAIFRSEGIAVREGTLQEYIARSMISILEPSLREMGIAPAAGMESIAGYLTGALCGLCRWWLESGMPASPEEMSSLFMRLSSRGLESLKEKA